MPPPSPRERPANGTLAAARGYDFRSRRRANRSRMREPTVLGTILIIVLILALLGALPNWGWSRSWGYYPSGGLGLVVIIVIVLVLLGRI
jgi:hypothetical protein